MTPKFKKSSISISGIISINTELKFGTSMNQINVELGGNKTSKSGVYCLRNKQNPERFYIGMATNLVNRRNRHFNDLLKNTHHAPLMHEDYIEFVDKQMCENENNVYFPQDLFEFEVIIYCRPSELTFYENILINTLHPYYNQKKIKES